MFPIFWVVTDSGRLSVPRGCSDLDFPFHSTAPNILGGEVYCALIIRQALTRVPPTNLGLDLEVSGRLLSVIGGHGDAFLRAFVFSPGLRLNGR
jgi:hypothetical protein